MIERSAELSSVLSRLEKVERENSRLKRIGLGVLLVIGAALLMGQTRSNRIIEAEGFVLKDANGRTRGKLSMELSDRPSLTLLDTRGFPVASLGAGESPLLTLCKRSCENQVQLGTFSNDLFGLALYGKDKGEFHGLRAGFGVFKGVPGINLYGDDDPAEQVALDLEAGPRLVLSDPNGVVAMGKTSLSLSDKQGFRTTIGSADLETPLTGETHKTSAASIVLSGKDGKTLFSAP